MFTGLMHKARDRDEGFTLIELLVVVIIIGILAAIAIPTYLNQRESAWRSAVKSDLRSVAADMQTYYAEHGYYHNYAMHSNGTAWWSANGGSEGVSIYPIEPDTDSDKTQTFCLMGTHEELDGTVAIYESDDGGLDTSDNAWCE